MYNTAKGKKAFKKEGMKKTTLFFKQYFGRVKKMQSLKKVIELF